MSLYYEILIVVLNLLFLCCYFRLQLFTRKLCLQFSGLRMRNFTWNRFPIKNLLIDSLLTPIVESTYLSRDMCKFESSQKDESRWQSTDSLKAYRNTSAFKCYLLLSCFYRLAAYLKVLISECFAFFLHFSHTTGSLYCDGCMTLLFYSNQLNSFWFYMAINVYQPVFT